MKQYILLTLLAVILLVPTKVNAQMKLTDGYVMMGQYNGSGGSWANAFIGGYNQMQWTGTSSLYVSMNNRMPRIAGNNRIIRFYNTESDTYNNVGVKTTFAFMYDTNAAGSAVTNALEKVVGLDAGTASSESASPFWLSATSVQQSVPELTVEDEDGHTLMDINSLVPLLVGTLQSLQQQADEQSKQIDALGSVNTKKVQSKQMDLTAIDVAEADANILDAVSPNPFKTKVSVSYRISDMVQTAKLRVNDMNGQVVSEFTLTERGKAKTKLEGQHWPTGIYFCSLIVDGEIVGTQKIIKK